MLMTLEQSDANRLGFMASGILTDNDYKNFLIPQVREVLAQYASIRLLFQLEGFRGWELQAAWDELVFGVEINSRVERVAVIGDQEWERWMAKLSTPFSHGEVRYFELTQVAQAWQWLAQESAVGSTAG